MSSSTIWRLKNFNYRGCMIKWFLRETLLSVHLLIGFSFYAKCIKSLSYLKYNIMRYKFKRKGDIREVLTSIFWETIISNYISPSMYSWNPGKATGTAWHLVWLEAGHGIASETDPISASEPSIYQGKPCHIFLMNHCIVLNFILWKVYQIRKIRHQPQTAGKGNCGDQDHISLAAWHPQAKLS